MKRGLPPASPFRTLREKSSWGPGSTVSHCQLHPAWPTIYSTQPKASPPSPFLPLSTSQHLLLPPYSACTPVNIPTCYRSPYYHRCVSHFQISERVICWGGHFEICCTKWIPKKKEKRKKKSSLAQFRAIIRQSNCHFFKAVQLSQVFLMASKAWFNAWAKKKHAPIK